MLEEISQQKKEQEKVALEAEYEERKTVESAERANSSRAGSKGRVQMPIKVVS